MSREENSTADSLETIPLVKISNKKSRIQYKVRSEDRSFKSILPKTEIGDVIAFESELLPCAFNLNRPTSISEKMLVGSETANVADKKEDLAPTILKPKPKLNINTKKKMAKNLKNVEASLAVFQLEDPASIAKKEENYAEQYLQRVQERLVGTNDELYKQFIDLISGLDSQAFVISEVYKQITQIFSEHQDLAEDFIMFLTAEQAHECGVFMEHLLLTKMADFLTMVDVCFVKSPQQVKKIHRALSGLSEKQDVTAADVSLAVLPLLKGNQVLKDHFLQLLPTAKPPVNFLVDYEELDCGESTWTQGYETIHVPPHWEDDRTVCDCSCHASDASLLNHCVSCSTRFINGKVFKLIGKLLKPAKVVFHDHDMDYHRDRLAHKTKTNVKRSRKRSSNSNSKDTTSPSNCNEEAITEDDKAGRTGRNKSLSPKRKEKAKYMPQVKQEEELNESEIKCEVKEEVEEPWNIEEDRIILQTLQIEENCEETFKKISGVLLTRSVQDIKKRFNVLLSMLLKMKAAGTPAETKRGQSSTSANIL